MFGQRFLREGCPGFRKGFQTTTAGSKERRPSRSREGSNGAAGSKGRRPPADSERGSKKGYSKRKAVRDPKEGPKKKQIIIKIVPEVDHSR
jgi:hypothetical protein